MLAPGTSFLPIERRERPMIERRVPWRTLRPAACAYGPLIAISFELENAAMARFSTKHSRQVSDAPSGLEQRHISTSAVLIGSLGVLGCASVIVTLLMAG
jgi:hypothetical protein